MALFGRGQTHTLLVGGSRSGKTFLIVRAIIVRALSAPGSRHAILRFRFNAAKQSIAMDTMPKVLELCFPGVPSKWNDQMGYLEIGGSEIWIGGLDDKLRTEKVLGLEFASIYLNESSQIPWTSVELMRTRLAQVVQVKLEGQDPRPLRLLMFYDANPPNKGHWTYRYFIQKVDPNTGISLPDHADMASMRMNPEDNAENLPPEYITKTLGGMSAKQQKRFRFGEWADANPSALFHEDDIDKWRQDPNFPIPDMVRMVVGVDPSGADDADNADNDAIGIIVGGLGTDGNAYLFEDCTVKAGPKTWGDIATGAFDRHQADVIVGETNYGGAMVGHVIQTARPRTNYKIVTATRGKSVRAEPFSALYEQGKVRHIGRFPELEEELAAYSTFGYTGPNSPNRADAWIWVLTELFPGMVNPRKKEKKKPEEAVYRGESAWMG